MIARSASVASFCSTIRSTRPSASRDAAVAGGVGEVGGDDGDRAAGAGVRRGQPEQGLAGEERDVPVGDDHGAAEVGGQGVESTLDGSAGALDVVLVDDDELLVEGRAHLDHAAALVAHDERDVLGLGGPGGADGVTDQGHAAMRWRTLEVADHAGALTGGEDDDGGGPGVFATRKGSRCSASATDGRQLSGAPRGASHRPPRGSPAWAARRRSRAATGPRPIIGAQHTL